MSKDYLRELVDEAQCAIEILEAFLPMVETKDERDMLLNDIYIFALKRDMYYLLLDDDYNYNTNPKEYADEAIQELTKTIDTHASYLKWAKQPDVIDDLDESIRLNSYRRDIYLNL